MTTYIVTGSKKPLSGNVVCNGSKNAASKVLMFSLLSRQSSVFSNIPDIGDLDQTYKLLESLDVQIIKKDNQIIVNPSFLKSHSLLQNSNRLSISLFAIMAHHFDSAILPSLDGCNLGTRGIDIHLQIYEQFGINITHTDQFQTNSNMVMSKRVKELVGQNITLSYPSVGATDTAILLAVLAKGTSVIKNIALEPEVIETINLLNVMGSRITWKGPNTLEITGVKQLKGAEFIVMPDRLEAVTWAVLAYLSSGSINVEGIRIDHLQTFLGHFNALEGSYGINGEKGVRFYSNENAQSAFYSICANTYPCLATDQLAQTACMLIKKGGFVHDMVYERRMEDLHTMLLAFGVDAHLSKQCNDKNCRFYDRFNHFIRINPSKIQLPSGSLTLPKNIRCAHSYLLLASQAEGTVILHDPTDSIHRGYNKHILINKMQQIGIQATFEN